MCNAHFERVQIIPKQRANSGFSAKTNVTITRRGSNFHVEDIEKNRANLKGKSRQSCVNEPCHADQIVTLGKRIATLEFRDHMLSHVDKYYTFKNATT